MINQKTYTLAELTPLLCPNCGEDEAYRISRKVQNQVNVGLIHPIVSKHTGRGVHRKYARIEVYKARVLLELEPFQVPNTVLQHVANFFDDANPDRKSPLTRQSTRKKEQKKNLSDLLSNTIKDKQDSFLIINNSGSGGLQAYFGTDRDVNPTWLSAIILNLREIFRTVK